VASRRNITPVIADRVQTVLLRSGGHPDAPVRAARGTLAPGAMVGGRYRIDRLLGAGGMARVWLADDVERRMQVAFKEMLVPRLRTAAELEESALLFRREYFAMKKLQHPGTVKVFDCGVMETGNRYLTMEVVPGRDLSDIAAGPLPAAEVHRILARMAQILGFVHSRLFVHCDVKAENIRITDAGDVKLMDFGIMHPIGTRATGNRWGTPEYMAPEWREHGIIDGRSDLYSLGVLAFYLLTKLTPRTPDEGAGAGTGVASHAGGHHPAGEGTASDPAAALAAVPGVDPALSAVILRLLERDPRDRFGSAAELVAALHAASGEPIADEPIAARASYLQLPVVVGRAREVAELAARLAAARTRSSRALLIGAPAGVGKSRLLQELELDARNLDVPFALGQCRAEGLSPRAPVEQALRALIPATPAVVLDPLRPLLGKLLPSVATASTVVFRDPGKEKIAVFEALSRWLRTLAEIGPFILAFEDLHWADSATLETMNVIIRALHGTGGLVVATFRSDELGRLSLAFQTVDEGLTDHVELAPLSEHDLTTLVELALQGFHPGPALARNLYETTRGNAFFATECLRALIEDGTLTRQLGTWTAAPGLSHRRLPRSIKEAVLARLSTLSGDQVALFQRLAPAGRMLDVPLIRAVGDIPDRELFQRLDEGVERQFLQYVEGRYFFTHATVHEAIYEGTPEPMRRRFHKRIAEHLVHSAGDRPEAARAIGYHFARSDEPTRAIDPLRRAAARAIDDKTMFDAFLLLEEVAGLLEANPGVPDRDARLIAVWGSLVEVGYTSSTPACVRYAQKLFQHWDATVDLARGRSEIAAALEAVIAAPTEQHTELLTELFPEVPIHAARHPRDVFLKRSEYRILESIALAITGRTAELFAGLDRTDQEHPAESPYRAATHVAIGGLTSHTGHFRYAVDEMREHIAVLRGFIDLVAACPRRLQWALGMGAYFMNMNLALMGLPLDQRATADGFEIAERLGFTDLRIYHLFSQIVRAAFIGDGSAYLPPFAEMNDLMHKLGNPLLPARNLAIYTPPYYLERGELEMARAVIERGEHLARLLPGDRWLQLYVDVYRACLHVAAETEDADALIAGALASARASDFRMETLVLIYQARFETARGDRAAARAAAEAALARATDPLRANPFDEILARRALAEVGDDGLAIADLSRALTLATRTHNVLQEGIVRLALVGRLWAVDRRAAEAHLDAAEACFTAARAERWLRRAQDQRGIAA
jgi:hypothetical protein